MTNLVPVIQLSLCGCDFDRLMPELTRPMCARANPPYNFTPELLRTVLYGQWPKADEQTVLSSLPGRMLPTGKKPQGLFFRVYVLRNISAISSLKAFFLFSV